jgi:hypothetical protein
MTMRQIQICYNNVKGLVRGTATANNNTSRPWKEKGTVQAGPTPTSDVQERRRGRKGRLVSCPSWATYIGYVSCVSTCLCLGVVSTPPQ